MSESLIRDVVIILYLHELAKKSVQVTLMEQQEIKRGDLTGTGGAIVPSHCDPLAASDAPIISKFSKSQIGFTKGSTMVNRLEPTNLIPKELPAVCW